MKPAFPRQVGGATLSDDLALALLFLCGAGGAYMTGQIIHVNGGSFMP